jgi:uncharacterized YigZ family protein
MQCINAPTIIEDIIKKSRFIGFIYPCMHEADVLAYLDALRIEHAAANHIVFAYRIKTEKGIVCRFHDAGEPSGTAGKPIYKYIEGHDLINVLIVVVRYFGGIKLGAGGLTRAYGGTAKLVIAAADIMPYIEKLTLQFTLDYNQLQPFEYHVQKLSGDIISKDFSGQVQVQVLIAVTDSRALLELFPGRVI